MESELQHTEGTAEPQPASRGDRFAAAMLDGLIMIVIVLVPLLLIYGFEGIMELQRESGFVYSLTMFAIGQGVYLSVQGYLLYTYGQTVGKRYLGIRIVDLNNNLPPMQALYGRRVLFLSLISIVPIIGTITMLIDPLLIFRNVRRCLHDLIADTKVVKV